MRVMIIGCGRLGSALALELFKKGNEVTVIDRDSEVFYRLGTEFSGNTIVGMAYDKDTLEEAGIQFMDAVIVCTSSDEMNATTGRVAKDIYMVPRVLARLNDPHKAKIYESLGLRTISTTGYAVDRALELLSYDRMDSVAMLGESGDTEIVRIVAPADVQGAKAAELSLPGCYNLVAIVRGSSSLMPEKDETIRTSDILYFTVNTREKAKLKRALGL